MGLGFGARTALANACNSVAVCGLSFSYFHAGVARILEMPRRQAEVEQGGDLHRFQQADGVEREALALAEFSEVLFAQASSSFAAHSLSEGWQGRIGCRPSGETTSRFALQHGERDSLVLDDDAERRGQRVGGGEADQFHGSGPLLYLECS